MERGKREEVERLTAKIADLEALIEKWAHANDPESKWMLYLLREALEMGRLKLGALNARATDKVETSIGKPSS